MQNTRTENRLGLTLVLVLGLSACSGEDTSELDHGDDAGANTDGGGHGGDGSPDGGSEEDAAVIACPSTGIGTLVIELEPATGLAADVRVSASDGGAVTGSPFTAGATLEVTGGSYTVEAGRVLVPGTIVGRAYQGVVDGDGSVCVRDGQTTTVHVSYVAEPGSEKLWLTNGSGEGQILAFAADALAAGGTQAVDVTLDGKLTSPSALRVDARGTLWVGDRTGKVVGFPADALGTSSNAGPEIVLEGPALCGETLPCGPRALAFDVEGALWVALLDRIVKLPASALEASGEPEVELTITSPDAARPVSLAFDAQGSLWVGEDQENGVAKFAAERLVGDVENEAADVVIFAEQGPPVVIGLSGPDGLVFDRDGNLWVGYFAGNNLARFTPSELTASATLTPGVLFAIDVTALVTDLAMDESGNLWMPGSAGSVVRVDAAELEKEAPALVRLESAAIGSVEKIALHSVSGPLFIAP
jgi:sugar lactone lactonase YvrE